MVVTTRNPWRHRALVAVGVAAALLCGWGLYSLGYHRAGVDITAARAQVSRLTRTTTKQQAAISSLQEQKALLSRSSEVDRQSAQDLKTTVAQLQGELAQMKQDVAFYRGIVSPQHESSGLHIDSFDLSPGHIAHGYHYKLVLTQVMKNDTVVRGDASFSVDGMLQGQPHLLELREISPERESALHYRFKYFQNFEGDIVLPKGFKPMRVVVTVSPKGRHSHAIERVFDWPAEEK